MKMIKRCEYRLIAFVIVGFIFACSGNGTDSNTGDSPSDFFSTCGNNTVEPGEACDGTDLNGYRFESLAAGYISGTISCKQDCSGYVMSDGIKGNTISADSCSQLDVQAAIDSASHGDTVLIPAGECTWSSANQPAVTMDKGILLKGAGIDQTIITDDTGSEWNERALWVDVDKPYTWRITQISFTDTLSSSVSDAVVSINGDCDSWRIDHLKFFDLNKMAIRTRSYSPGVIDHCSFLDQHRSTIYFNNYISGENSPDSLWSRPTELGTKEAIYIEDCEFEVSGENHPASDGEYGNSWVFRYNTCTNFWVLTHGYESNRSAIKMEVYNNTFNVIDTIFRVISYRGGTGVAFNNTVLGDPSYFIGVMYYCGCPDQTGGSCRTDLGQLPCTQYPCMDQPGRTYNQKLLPIFQWNNTWESGSTDFYVHDVFDPCPIYNRDILKENRDFYNDAVTYSVQTGEYSATYTEDDGSLQQWNYKPYPYPHPLVQLDAL